MACIFRQSLQEDIHSVALGCVTDEKGELVRKVQTQCTESQIVSESYRNDQVQRWYPTTIFDGVLCSSIFINTSQISSPFTQNWITRANKSSNDTVLGVAT